MVVDHRLGEVLDRLARGLLLRQLAEIDLGHIPDRQLMHKGAVARIQLVRGGNPWFL